MHSKITITRVGYLFFTLIMAVVYYHLALRVPLNSDIASALLEAKDVAGGNVLLQGWSLSTGSFYFTEILWYALIIKVFGYSYKLAHIIPAIYLATLSALTVYSCKSRLTGFFLVAFFLASPTIAMAVNVLHTVIHVGTYIYCLICFNLALRYVDSGKIWMLCVMLVILSMTFASDSISFYLFFIPALMVLVVSFLSYSLVSNKRWAVVFLVCAIAFSLSMLFKHFISVHGFVTPGIAEPKLASSTAVAKNILDMFFGALHLYDANLFGMAIRDAITSLAPVSLFIMSGFAILVIVGIFKSRMVDAVDVFLITATLITPLAFIFSDVSQGQTSIRYVLPSFIFGIIFISRTSLMGSFNYRTKLVVILALILTSAIHIKNTFNEPNYGKNAEMLSSTLASNGLTHGFAEFWNASSISVYGEVLVAPVYYNDKNIIPMPWLSKASWYSDENRFVIINDEKIKSAAINLYGPPDQVIEVAGYKVFAWGHEIRIGK